MSFGYLNAARREKAGNPHAKSILLYLAERANSKTGICFPTEETIALDLELGESTVRKWLKHLAEKKKLISITKRAGASWKHNAYKMLFEPDAATVEIDLSPLRDSGDKISPLQRGAIPENSENITATTYHRHEVAIDLQDKELSEPEKNVDLDESKSTATEFGENAGSVPKEETPPSPPAPEENEPPKKPKNPPRRKKQTKPLPGDPRCHHPAIELVRRLLQRYPVKEIWDTIIRDLGDAPDAERLARMINLYARLGWRGYDWLVWYARGIPPNARERLLVNADGFPLSEEEIQRQERLKNASKNGHGKTGKRFASNADKIDEWQQFTAGESEPAS